MRSASNSYCQCDGIPNYLAESGKNFIQGIRKASETVNGPDLDHIELAYNALLPYRTVIKNDLALRIYDDVMVYLMSQIVNFRFLRWTDQCIRNSMNAMPLPSCDILRQTHSEIYHRRLKQRDEYRQDSSCLDYASLVPPLKNTLAQLDKFVALFEHTTAFIEIRLRLADEWHRPLLEILLDGESAYLSSPYPRNAGDWHFFSFYIPISLKNENTAELKVSTDSSAPIDICNIQILRKGKHPIVPIAITEVQNLVANPGNILLSDSSWVSFGSAAGSSFSQKISAKLHNTLTLTIAETQKYTQY